MIAATIAARIAALGAAYPEAKIISVVWAFSVQLVLMTNTETI